MKQFWKDAGIAVMMGLIVPAVLLHIAVLLHKSPESETQQSTQPTQETISDTQIPVKMEDGTISVMELDTYLTGVVLAEMPVSFEAEAQKAQAIVARTYAMCGHLGRGKHDEAAVCVDSTCCQGYISQLDYLSSGGTMEGLEKVTAAVDATSGYVLTYEGELIEATYFSCSGGSTEDAVAVWGTDIPYLRATQSPGEEHARYFTDSVSFSVAEIEAALGVQLEGSAASWLGDVSYTAGGGVDTMVLGGEVLKGTQIRKCLNLRSTAFSMEAEDDVVTIYTRGYGHRVGMSQYGADAMAASGSTYAQILAHYYQGTALEKME